MQVVSRTEKFITDLLDAHIDGKVTAFSVVKSLRKMRFELLNLKKIAVQHNPTDGIDYVAADLLLRYAMEGFLSATRDMAFCSDTEGWSA